MKKMKSINNLKLLKNIALLLLGILVFYALLTYLLLPLYTRHWQGVKVPDVTYLSSAAAEKIVTHAKLRPVVAATKYDENFPPGFVLFQNPEAGSLVKNGRRIYLTVGKGKQRIPVPGLVGKSIRDARFILEQSNLKLGQTMYKPDSVFLEGVVSSQSIDSLVLVPIGQTIDLTVSLGYEPSVFVVPDLVGKSEEDALWAIKKAGLTLGGVYYQATERLIPRTVISQSLEPGSQVAKGDTLSIVVSRMAGTDKENLPW